MDKKVSIWTTLLVGAIFAVAAVLIYRTLFGAGPDQIDQDIDRLRSELAESQRQRDSLAQIIIVKQDSLLQLIAEESSLEESLSDLRLLINRKDNEIINIRSRLGHTTLTDDIILRDLNRIVRSISSDTSTVVGGS